MKKSKVALIVVAVVAVIAVVVALALGSRKEEVVEEEPTTEEVTTTEEITTTEEPTTEIVHEGVYNDLTGEWNTDREEEYGRPITVMLNNISEALPQCDIGKADIVYEMTVEGGITRLLGVFSDYEDLEYLGSIRSCRPYYVTVSMEFDAIYLHYGQSPQGEEELESTGIDNLSGLAAIGSTVYFRTSDRSAPHNVFTTGEMIVAGIEKLGYRTTHEDDFESKFSFNEEDTELEEGEKCYTLTTPISSYTHPWFEYNEEDGLYYRFEYKKEQVDGNTDEQLCYKNVIIQFAHYTSIDDHDRQQLDLVGSGTGLYATNGEIISITWEKADSNSQTKYYTADGEELQLNPGKTWITVFEENNADEVTWE